MSALKPQLRWPIASQALVVLCVLIGPCRALEPNRALTQYMHRIWQSPQGLPFASVRTIYQTSDGYLWLGTESGLVRFDGVRFTGAPDLADRLPADISVAQLLEDTRHNLWIATRNAGLLRLHDGIVDRASASDGSVSCLVRDAASNLWACTPGGVLEVQPSGTRFLGAEAGLAPNGALAACATRDGHVWFGGQGRQLSIWDGHGFTQRTVNSLPALAAVGTMLAARDGSVWVGTSDGLVRIDGRTEKRFTESDGLPGHSILSLAEGQDGTLWIGTNAGFSRLRKGEIESYTTRAGLSQSTIYALLEDADGSLWVGTKRGLNQFLDRRTVPVTTSEGLPSNDTGPVFQDEEGTIWVGTLGAGLARVRPHHIEVLTTRDGLASNYVHALAGGHSGDLWVGTDCGLNRLDSGRPVRTWRVREGLPADLVRSLYPARNGTLWVGTSRGLAVLREGGIVRVAGGSIVSIAGDGHGRVYVAREGNGVSVFDEDTLKEDTREWLPIRNAASLYEEDGRLWIGTLGSGLHLLDHGRLAEFLPKDGLFDDEIYGITSGGDGRLWMACSKGLFSVKQDELRGFAAGTVKHLASTPYSPLDGLQAVECQSGVQPAVWHMKDGHVSFSTIRGLLLIDPQQADWKLPAPRAVVEQVIINGRNATAGAVPPLFPGTQNVDFLYTGLGFRSPGRITFRYLLEGFNRAWVDAGARREASYTNLQPGRYRFRLAACIGEGNCTETAGPGFVIPARFYQTAWFPFLCAAGFFGVAWLAYQVRIRHLKREFSIILGERSRIARELHDTLLQGFSGVTMEMQALAARLPGESKSILDDIIRDAANCLREVRHLLANLRNQQAGHSGLASAVACVATEINPDASRLKLDLDQVPDALSSHVEYNLLRIIQEAMTNAVNHSGADRITVALRSLTGRIFVSVADDGSGFTDDGNVSGHYGLIGMRERAGEIGGDLRISSSPGKGTTVSVELPVPKNGKNGIRVSAAGVRGSAMSRGES